MCLLNLVLNYLFFHFEVSNCCSNVNSKLNCQKIRKNHLKNHKDSISAIKLTK